MKRTIRQTVFPILTAFIWGTAFTAQSVGADYVGPLTFNALRSLIAFFALLVLDLAGGRPVPRPPSPLPLPGRGRDFFLPLFGSWAGRGPGCAAPA